MARCSTNTAYVEPTWAEFSVFFFLLLWAPVEGQTSAEPAIDVVLYVLAINVGQYVFNCFCYRALKGLPCRIPYIFLWPAGCQSNRRFTQLWGASLKCKFPINFTSRISQSGGRRQNVTTQDNGLISRRSCCRVLESRTELNIFFSKIFFVPVFFFFLPGFLVPGLLAFLFFSASLLLRLSLLACFSAFHFFRCFLVFQFPCFFFFALIFCFYVFLFFCLSASLVFSFSSLSAFPDSLFLYFLLFSAFVLACFFVFPYFSLVSFIVDNA